jgi:hypothetical protein
MLVYLCLYLLLLILLLLNRCDIAVRFLSPRSDHQSKQTPKIALKSPPRQPIKIKHKIITNMTFNDKPPTSKNILTLRPPSSTMSASNNTSNAQSNFFHSSTELADLGRERFDHDTAQITDRDASLHSNARVTVRQGRAPRGLENKVFAWTTFQYTTDQRDDREELKGDLHEGQLHRLNKAARDPQPMMGFGGDNGGGGRGGRGGGRGGRGGRADRGDGKADALCAGRKPEGKAVPPMAKGFPEELDKSLFWDEPIV